MMLNPMSLNTQLEPDANNNPPLAIRSHPDYPLWSKPWLATHKRPWMYSIVIIGKPGRGKSSFSIALGNLLDRSRDNSPRFSLDRVFFDNNELITQMQQKNPAGTVHIMDDAGMDLFRRDAMASKVKGAIKVAMTMRYKRPIMIYNLPDLDMLDKSIIKLSDLLITVWNYNRTTELTKLSVQFIKKYTNNPTIYYPYPVVLKEMKTSMGISWRLRVRKRLFYFYKCPDEILKEYNAVKDQQMGRKWGVIKKKMKAGDTQELNMQRIREYMSTVDKVGTATVKTTEKSSNSFANRKVNEKTTEDKLPEEDLQGWED